MWNRDRGTGSRTCNKRVKLSLEDFLKGLWRHLHTNHCDAQAHTFTHIHSHTHRCNVLGLLWSIRGMIRRPSGRKKTVGPYANSLSPDRVKQLFFGGKHTRQEQASLLGKKRKAGKQELNDAECAARLAAWHFCSVRLIMKEITGTSMGTHKWDKTQEDY